MQEHTQKYSEWKLITLIYVSIVHCLMDFLCALSCSARFAVDECDATIWLAGFWLVGLDRWFFAGRTTGGVRSDALYLNGLCLMVKQQKHLKNQTHTKKFRFFLFIDERWVGVSSLLGVWQRPLWMWCTSSSRLMVIYAKVDEDHGLVAHEFALIWKYMLMINCEQIR